MLQAPGLTCAFMFCMNHLLHESFAVLGMRVIAIGFDTYKASCIGTLHWSLDSLINASPL